MQQLRQVGLLLMSCFLAPQLRAQSSQLESEYLSIEDHLVTGDHQTALAMIEADLQRVPNDPGLLNLRGVVWAQRNVLTKAREDFQSAVNRAPHLLPAWRNLAKACETLNDPVCSVRAWQTVNRAQAGDAESLLGLAMGYAGTGRYAASLQALRQLPAAQTNEPLPALLRCFDLTQAGQLNEASTVATLLNEQGKWAASDWSRVASLFRNDRATPVAVTLLQNLRQRKAADVPALQDLALAYERLKRPADARRILEEVSSEEPANPAHLFELARLSDEEGRYEESLGYLAHARDLQPHDATVYFVMAKVEMELNLVAEARHSLEEALTRDPANPGYNYAMGFVLLSTRDAATAGTFFRKFLEEHPGNEKGHYALGVALYAAGDYEGAKQQLATVQVDRATAGGAEYFLGCIARREDRPAAAAEYLHQSIALLPSYAESHTELARLFLAQKNAAGAEAELRKALAINPDSFGANEQLLLLYKRTHDGRAEAQEATVKRLDVARSERADLMFRSVQFKP